MKKQERRFAKTHTILVKIAMKERRIIHRKRSDCLFLTKRERERREKREKQKKKKNNEREKIYINRTRKKKP
jgi:hypothetical protein